MTRWRCRLYQPWLVDGVDGVLNASRQRRLERHLASCSGCRADLEALRELPEALRTSVVHDPGDAFWLQQRQAIGRTIRNLPAPRSGWHLDWLREALQLSPWRYPLAAMVALVLALSVYHLAERRPPETGAASVAAQLAALDSGVLLALDEVSAAVTPADDALHYTPREDDLAFAALAVGDLVGTHTLSHVPDETELSDADLEGMGELLGGIG
jgi:anti-sigma factor RsiW